MLFEKSDQGLVGRFGIFAFEAVAGTLHCEQLGLDTAGFEAVDHPDRLFVSNIFVFGAVNAEGGGSVWGDPVERAGTDMGGEGSL